MSDDMPDLRASHEDRDRVVDMLRLDFTHAVSSPGIAIDTDGLNLTYSKLKLHSKSAAADLRLRIELVGKLLHAKVIEQRPRRQSAMA
jgi:hypothetical protein